VLSGESTEFYDFRGKFRPPPGLPDFPG
jgi:hypothetical protein